MSEQLTPAGRFVRVGRQGMDGLLRGLNRDALARGARSRLRIDYVDRKGNPRSHTIYGKGGLQPGRIADELEARGATAGDPSSVHAALRRLVDDVSTSPEVGAGGGSRPPDMRRITGVTVSPA